jgi:hypothetical protein
MSNNPLQKHFRRPALWIKLPTLGRWYTDGSVAMNQDQQVRIFGLNAKDDIMLNTPDALLNGHALESVIQSCVPEVRDVKKLLQPDLDAIFLGIKAATNNGRFEIERKCEECKHENTFEVQCARLIDMTSYVENSDTEVMIGSELLVKIKPYSYEMRTLMIQKQLEEQRVLSAIENDQSITDDIQRADILARSIDKLATLTFSLVAQSITAVEMLGPDGMIVTDTDHITEWLTNIDKSTADAVISAVNALNEVGPPKETDAQCTECGHRWKEKLSFDPALFFTQRSQP